MRYSANLNIIIKAIEKATARMTRDFIELENLQTNTMSANKFGNACYNKIKQDLAGELLKARPDYNIIFSDGQKVIKNQNAEYTYIIFAIDGFNNLIHSGSDFTVAIALEHLNENGQKESISVAVHKLVGGELFYCEKGFGAFLNNRRIRVSKRGINDAAIIASEDQNLLSEELMKKAKEKPSYRSYGCRTLEIAYLAASRVEAAIFQNKNCELLRPFFLLAREAGGKVFENEKTIFTTNGLIDFNL